MSITEKIMKRIAVRITENEKIMKRIDVRNNRKKKKVYNEGISENNEYLRRGYQ